MEGFPPRQYQEFPTMQPNQAYLQRLIEEDRRKKKKVLLIAIPSAVVIIGIVAVLLAVFLGGGMSPTEYSEMVLPEHEKVMAALEDIEVEWKDAYYDVYINSSGIESYKQDCAQIIARIDVALAAMDDATTVLEGITPPKEAETLQADLLDYYSESSQVFNKIRDMYQYLPALSIVLTTLENDVAAVPDIEDSATLAEALAILDQSMTPTTACRDRLLALAPTSSECQQINNGLTDHYNTMVGLNEQLYAAANALNISGMESVIKQIDAEETTYYNSRETRLLPLQDIATEYALFIEKGNEYTSQLEDLGVKK